jgi:hypothetical protein
VPFSPLAGGCEHATTAAHVTEGGLAGTVGTATSNTWDTGYGTTGTPRFGGVFHTRIVLYSVGLTLVLGNVRVYEVDNIWADGGAEYERHGCSAFGVPVNAEYVYLCASGHGLKLCCKICNKCLYYFCFVAIELFLPKAKIQ